MQFNKIKRYSTFLESLQDEITPLQTKYLKKYADKKYFKYLTTKNIHVKYTTIFTLEELMSSDTTINLIDVAQLGSYYYDSNTSEEEKESKKEPRTKWPARSSTRALICTASSSSRPQIYDKIS